MQILDQSPKEAEIEEDEAEVSQAREQLLEAMALYNLRNRVVNNVLIANPILKGIHNSTYASPIEESVTSLPFPIHLFTFPVFSKNISTHIECHR